MKLHVVRASHNCRRVLALVEHLGLDVEIVDMNIGAGELSAPEFRALNPNGKVPTLQDGDFSLWESNAIMQYLAALNPQSDLWPDDPKTRADITRWQFWESCHLSRGTSPFGFENLFKPMFLKVDPDPEALVEPTRTFHRFAPVLNAQLEGKRYILGDTLTLADFSVGANFTYAEAAGLPWDDYHQIKAWWGRLNQLEAWKKTAPQM